MPTNHPTPASNPQDVRQDKSASTGTQSVKTPQGGKEGQGGGNPPPVNRPNSK